MKRRDMKLLLEERFERIALLETRIDTMDQLVEGYRAREQAIFDTLSAAKENAAKLLEQAKTEGAQVRAEAEAVKGRRGCAPGSEFAVLTWWGPPLAPRALRFESQANAGGCPCSRKRLRLPSSSCC